MDSRACGGWFGPLTLAVMALRTSLEIRSRVMGKKSRLKRERRGEDVGGVLWSSDDGVHAVGVGQPPSPLETAAMTEAYQQRIRSSPIWDQMVREFGEQKATEMLKDFRVKIDDQP